MRGAEEVNRRVERAPRKRSTAEPMSTLAPTRRVGRRLPTIVAAGLLLAALLPGNTLRPVPVRAVDCAVNPIPCENQLTGTDPTIWDTPNGDAGSPNLQGFATDISVNVGQTISFKINSGTLHSYAIDIYRMGWYQGNGARKITSISPSATLPQTQPACLTDGSTGLVDCGNWAVSASWSVPSNAVSGIYFARLAASASVVSQIVFVVRNDASHSDILLRTDDTTWVAYNDYGGNNVYYGNTGSSNGRAYKGSYNRPFNLRSESAGYGTSNFVFYGEYPMVRWLESNGYDVSYSTAVDLVRFPDLPKNHRVLLTSGHDEYWSNEMRAATQSARDAGVSLANFTGNEDFWKTRWEPSLDSSHTANRTVVVYKETLDNRVLDPQDPPTWTGTWRDPRFSPPADGGKPENQLGGTIFTVNRGSTTPILTAQFAKLRFWRNTAVAGLTGTQTVQLGDQTIGYEWDEDLDNGFRPSGQIDMSSTTVTVPEHILDYGSTYGQATATHRLTLYRAASGALVFAAGTVQWAWGLDANHDIEPDIGPANPDLNMQQATLNLLADMGVQPTTMQAGLVAATASADHTAPASTITAPTGGATETSGTAVTISGTASDAGGGVVAGVEVSTDSGATWHPATGTTSWSYTWTPGPTGSFTIKSRASDDSANVETPGAGVGVTVNPRPCPCSLFPSTAAPAGSGDTSSVELGVKFTADQGGYINAIKFFKPSVDTGTHVASLWTSAGQLIGQGTFSNETASGWQTYTFPTPVPISANTTYIASYHAPNGGYPATPGFFTQPDDVWPLHAPSGSNGVFAYAAGSTFPNQTFNATNYWVDVVYNSNFVDTVAPGVTSVSPSPNATNAPFSSPAVANFNKAVVPSSINFTVKDPGNNPVAGSVAWNGTTNAATFTPTAPLAQGTMFTATVSGAADSSGNVMASPFSWSFTTMTCPCTIWPSTATPATPSANDGTAIEVGVKFQTDVNGYVSGVRFYKGSANTGTHVGSLWTSSGQLLSQATFTSESASGWQSVSFPDPVAVTAGTTYVASYHSSGGYAVSSFGLQGSVDNSPLHALASGSSGGNGVFVYAGSSTFPTQTYNAGNYWVDVSFNTIAQNTTPPTLTAQTPTPGATKVAFNTGATATFSKAVQQPTIAFTLKDPSNATVPATLSYNATTRVATLQPNALLAQSTTFTATVSGATDNFGNVMTPVSWTFTTSGCPCSIFPSTATPQTASVQDNSAIEVGMKLRTDVAGTITGVRFYKGAQNTGTHVAHLWSSTGQLLATATFSGETASGWQQASFPTPVQISANTTYVISYHTDVGFYSATGGYFAGFTADAWPLHGLADGTDGSNGLYAYGAGAFPTSSFGSTNYYVDVVFTVP
jgi:Domain of unknown function (DUF4082)/Bacterial Ig-like domain/Bacterial Ig domain